jgi:hypothetical protein
MKNYNIGTKLLENKKYLAAIPFLEKASDNPFKYLNLGNCYRETEDYKKAEECYAKGLSLKIAKMDDADTKLARAMLYTNWGLLYVRIGDDLEAIKYFDKSIGIDPEFKNAHCNKVFSLIRLEPGNPVNWNGYDYRFETASPVKISGNFSSLYGKWWNEQRDCRVLLAVEQGLGDTIMFARFIPILEKMYNIQCDLYSPIPIYGIKTIQEFNFADYDYMKPLGSILCYMDKIEPSDGYISTDKRVEVPKGINIGIVWEGNAAHSNNKFRSCAVERFKPLTKYATLHSLNPAAKCPGWVTKYQIKDWEDTCAIINSMDLIISVDTSIVHMAGAMGKITWLLQPVMQSDFRWGTGENNVFYTSVRAMKNNNWDDLFVRLEETLKCALGGT